MRNSADRGEGSSIAIVLSIRPGRENFHAPRRESSRTNLANYAQGRAGGPNAPATQPASDETRRRLARDDARAARGKRRPERIAPSRREKAASAEREPPPRRPAQVNAASNRSLGPLGDSMRSLSGARAPPPAYLPPGA